MSYGSDAVFTGSVIRPDSTAGAGEVVAVQEGATGIWVTIGRTSAADDGSRNCRLPWRRGGAVRARAAGVTSKVETIALLPVLSARRPAKRVRAGSRLHVTGRFRPAVPVVVRIEKQGSDGRFRRVTSVRCRVVKTAWGATLRLKRPGLYGSRRSPATGSSLRRRRSCGRCGRRRTPAAPRPASAPGQ